MLKSFPFLLLSNLKQGLLFSFLLLSFSAQAQKSGSLNGVWTGIISQNDGYRTEYEMELYLTQDGNDITGRSFVFVDDIYAEIEIKGKTHGKSILLLKDVNIVEDEIPDGFELCMKDYQIVIKKDGDNWKLEGQWQGKTKTTICKPGKIKLQRMVPRA